MEPVLGRNAAKSFGRLNADTQDQIISALNDLCKIPPEGDIKRLHGMKYNYRLRVGGYRILYDKLENGGIFVGEIISRGQAYKKEFGK